MQSSISYTPEHALASESAADEKFRQYCVLPVVRALSISYSLRDSANNETGSDPMPIEVEKKYRLTASQRDAVRARLPEIGAKREGEEFEENTLYTGDAIELGQAVLRLRRIDDRALLTYKEPLGTRTDIKEQLEWETAVDNPDAIEFILEVLGYYPALVYEKRRETWRLEETEILVDELPFGLFMEIEGEEQSIRDIESKLAIKRLAPAESTYPRLTMKHGINIAGVIEARFEPQK